MTERLILFILILLLAACGSSPDEQLLKTHETGTTNITPWAETPANISSSSSLEETPVPTSTITPPLSQAIGDTITNAVDGAVMAYIPAGEFQMGGDLGQSDEKPVHTVNLDAFWIYQYEVTNHQFAAFLNTIENEKEEIDRWLDTGANDARIYQNGGEWQIKATYTDHPIVNVSWYGATAYCNWAGGRLPTEAEWEKAARGGLKGEYFPWGEEFPVCKLKATNGAQNSACTGQTVPVGSFAPNGYGLYDMAGNVWEMVNSCYQVYTYNPIDGREDPEASCSRIIRGGSWYYYVSGLRVSFRDFFEPSTQANDMGFRCVLPIENN